MVVEKEEKTVTQAPLPAPPDAKTDTQPNSALGPSVSPPVEAPAKPPVVEKPKPADPPPVRGLGARMAKFAVAAALIILGTGALLVTYGTAGALALLGRLALVDPIVWIPVGVVGLLLGMTIYLRSRR
jgi:hypothetical protein